MKYLIIALLSAAFVALATPKAPALTNSAVHKSPVVKPTAKPVTATRTVPPQPEKPVAKEASQQISQPIVPPTYPTSCATYEPLVAQYTWNVKLAMAIMQAESGCNPYAVSNASINYDSIPDYGLFQIHGQDILNPSENIAVAYQKYERQGWGAWSTYNSGAVWRYYQ
jgi:soluble lytic murein transglycosylase-like protein